MKVSTFLGPLGGVASLTLSLLHLSTLCLLVPQSYADDASLSIIGGEEAMPFKYSSWMVGLVSLDKRLPFCGASYIGKNIVLTAAHCVVDKNITSFRLEYRRHDWMNPKEKGVKLTPTEIVLHPKYMQGADQNNDIAIIKVRGGEDMPVFPSLDDGSYSDESQPREFRIIGWGVTGSNEPRQSPVLLQADVELYSQQTCRELYGDPRAITDAMICAKGPGRDTCQSDSGGPLFIEKQGGKMPVLVGVTSWGGICGGEAPGVYARISALRPFINRAMKCPAGTSFNEGKCQP